MKKALITGGAGFIGSHLAHDLRKMGVEVYVLDDLSTGNVENLPPEVEFVRGSVLDFDVVSKLIAECDVCYHLAAIASVQKCNTDFVSSHAVNITGLLTVIDCIRKQSSRARLVFASSAAVYGANQDVPLNEELKPVPISAYGIDKLACELHAQAASSLWNVSHAGLRFFNVYGPGQRADSAYSGVIAKFIRNISMNRPLEIYGDGLQSRDFVYVKDVVEAMKRISCMENLPRASINICTGVGTSVMQLAALIKDVGRSGVDIVFHPASTGDIKFSIGSNELLESLIQYTPRTMLQEGLSLTIDQS